MSKNIVLLIDGTNQGPEKRATIPTNVEGLAHFLDAEPLRVSAIPPRPLAGIGGLRCAGLDGVAGYISGIGIDTRPILDNFPAGTGHGMAFIIRTAYKFLVTRYEPGDCIYLFGFSRGAFAARSLAGFVDCVGVGLRAVSPGWIDQAIDQAYFAYEYLRGDTKAVRLGIAEFLNEFLQGSTHENEQQRLSFETLPIYFVGIWDAVEALGLPSKAAALTRIFNSYHQTRLPPNVSHAYHALAIHELRTDFEPHLWTESSRPGQILHQRWFPGDHSDIGGGHSDRSLPDRPLAWMLTAAETAGLSLLSSMRSGLMMDPPVGIHQKWQDGVYCVLPPTVREALVQYADLTRAPLVSTSFDESAVLRLSTRQAIDYSRFTLGFGKRFGFRSNDLQMEKLREADRATLRGLMRLDGRFIARSEAQQTQLMSSSLISSWLDADPFLSA